MEYFKGYNETKFLYKKTQMTKIYMELMTELGVRSGIDSHSILSWVLSIIHKNKSRIKFQETFFALSKRMFLKLWQTCLNFRLPEKLKVKVIHFNQQIILMLSHFHCKIQVTLLKQPILYSIYEMRKINKH